MDSSNEQQSNIICPNCGAENRAGTLICSNCGYMLSGGTVGATYRFDEDEDQTVAEHVDNHQTVHLDDRKITFPTGATFALHIREVDDPMILKPTEGETLLVGRRNKTNEFIPDVDMYPYAGFLLGVSRRHALIYREDDRLMLEDLGSSNGTFVNGVRLNPNDPYPLYDGIEVTLGKLHFTVRF